MSIFVLYVLNVFLFLLTPSNPPNAGKNQLLCNAIKSLANSAYLLCLLTLLGKFV